MNPNPSRKQYQRESLYVATTPCKKVRALVTSAKCKAAKGKKVKAMAKAIGREEKGNCDTNVVDKNPKTI
jgi:hypothetical protein